MVDDKKILKVIAGSKDNPLNIGDTQIGCYVLEDERRVLANRNISDALASAERRGSKLSGQRFKRIISNKDIRPYFSENILHAIDNPIIFDAHGREVHGIEATILADICDSLLEARNKGALLPGHTYYEAVIQAEILTRAFAKVGIVALVDEATGFQFNRSPEALRILMEYYVEEEAKKWHKEFPDSFFIQLDKIYGNSKTISNNRPQYYAKFIRKYIYEPLEKGLLLDELDNKNPSNKKGNRNYRHHQFLSEKLGLPALKERIYKVEAILSISGNKLNIAKQHLSKITPGQQITFNFDEM